VIINATDGSHRAVLIPLANGEGVEVELWQTAPACLLGRWVLSCPFHVALDAVHAHVAPLKQTDGGAVTGTSLRHREKTTDLTYDADLGRVVETRRK